MRKRVAAAGPTGEEGVTHDCICGGSPAGKKGVLHDDDIRHDHMHDGMALRPCKHRGTVAQQTSWAITCFPVAPPSWPLAPSPLCRQSMG